VQITKVKDAVEAGARTDPERRGADVAIEAVGVRKPGVGRGRWCARAVAVNFFGGCAAGTKVQLDTNRLHYSENYLEGELPSHTGDRAPGLPSDRGEKGLRARLHHRGSSAVALAGRAAPHAEPQRRHQDGDQFRATSIASRKFRVYVLSS